MSLTVDVWVVDQEKVSGRRILDVPPNASDLAGFERTRRTLWGTAAVRSLGAAFLPRLADGDLWVDVDEVAAFAAECAMLLAERAAITAATGYGEDFLEFRLANMIAAAQRARSAGGGVVVW